MQIAQLIMTLDLDHVLTQILRIMLDVIHAKKGSIFLLDRGGSPYRRFILQRNLPPEMSQVALREVLQHGLAGWVVREKRGAVVADIDEDERWLVFLDDEQEDVRSALCVPFLLEGEVQGVMTMVSDEPGRFSQADLELSTVIAGQASMVIHNAYLFDRVQAQRHQLETVLQNVGQPLFMLDHAFRVVLANNQASVLLGQPAAGVIGERVDVVGDNPMWSNLTQQMVGADFQEGHRLFEIHDEFRERDFQVNVAAIQRDEGLPGYIVVFSEVTSMKDLNRLKSHMIRMASHDLKNPLNIALGYINMTLMDLEQGEHVEKSWMEEVFRALSRMDTLIDDLLNDERIERESKFRSGSVDPYQLVNDTVAAIREGLNRKRQKLVQEIAPNMPKLTGDSAQLRQAMVNYLSNATKYTPEDGTITVRAYVDDGVRFLFTVQDTGLGIPKDQQASIFQRGYRAQRDAISDIEGNGVGLSLVAEIARRHKGRVWFTSEEGVGSTFGFSVPLET